jgi:predicted phosphodiesterase
MKVFAVSDLHVDYDENARWLSDLSVADYRQDVLILAGDVSDELPRVAAAFLALAKRFYKVVFVPGNHDLWLTSDSASCTSFDKFARICALAAEHGVSTVALSVGPLSIVPLFGWYDFSFGALTADVQKRWMDFRLCRWPDTTDSGDVTDYFLGLNEPALCSRSHLVITFSHFLPRIDVMPPGVSSATRSLFPVLGTNRLEMQLRRLNPIIHVYGHSHLNRDLTLDGTRYINNALGYPSEAGIAARSLRCIYDPETLPLAISVQDDRSTS